MKEGRGVARDFRQIPRTLVVAELHAARGRGDKTRMDMVAVQQQPVGRTNLGNSPGAVGTSHKLDVSPSLLVSATAPSLFGHCDLAVE